jgi:Transposase DDE domain group 1
MAALPAAEASVGGVHPLPQRPSPPVQTKLAMAGPAELVTCDQTIEDRIRGAKATGLANLPFDLWRRNQVWLELVLAAQDLTGWTQALLLHGELATAEPKTLRYRLLHVAARIVRHARRVIVRLQRCWPWAAELAAAFNRLRALPLRC